MTILMKAVKGDQEALKAFARYGIRPWNDDGSARLAVDVMQDIQKIQDGTVRQAAVLDLFGKGEWGIE